MKLVDECIPCQLKFAERTLRQAGVDEDRIPFIVDEIQKGATEQWKKTPAHYGSYIFKQVQKVSGKADPYHKQKILQNTMGKKNFGILKQRACDSNDRLAEALKISAVGNVIDLGAVGEYDVEEEIKKLDDFHFAVDDSESLKAALRCGKKVLFIADNCGEIFFDRVLIEILYEEGKNVYIAFKSGPIINDALVEDGVFAQMDRFATLIETGSDFLGVPPDKVDERFSAIMMEVDVVIGKGHANSETLDEWNRDSFLLLKAKCDVVAGYLGVEKGQFVLKHVAK